MRDIFKVEWGLHDGWTLQVLELVWHEPSFQAWWLVQMPVKRALFLPKKTILETLNKGSNLVGKEAIILTSWKRYFVRNLWCYCESLKTWGVKYIPIDIVVIFSNNPKQFFRSKLLYPPSTYIFTEIPHFFVIDKTMRRNLTEIHYQILILDNFE
jgi:hypothetical protein